MAPSDGKVRLSRSARPSRRPWDSWCECQRRGLRVLVACGAAGGIAATFNAPITGIFFGFEIILREFSFDALFATILSAVVRGSRESSLLRLGARSSPAIPHDLVVRHDYTYLLVAVLGLPRGLAGPGSKRSSTGLRTR